MKFFRQRDGVRRVHVYWTHMCIDRLPAMEKKGKEEEERGKKRVSWQEVPVFLNTHTVVAK